jgi:hypothetical protein
MQKKSTDFGAAEKAFERIYSIGKSRAVPRDEIEALLSESGIDLSSDTISSLLADATHEDGTVRIDTDKSNILLRVCELPSQPVLATVALLCCDVFGVGVGGMCRQGAAGCSMFVVDIAPGWGGVETRQG